MKSVQLGSNVDTTSWRVIGGKEWTKRTLGRARE